MNDTFDPQATRDTINPAQYAQEPFFARSVPVAASVPFSAYNEWVQVVPANPAVPGGDLALTAGSGSTFLASEPFFVAGAQTFVAPVDALVTRAPRREMLSDVGARDFAADGAALTTLVSFSFSGLTIGAAEWAYLYALASGAIAIRVATAGTITAGDLLPFGWLADVPSFRGRYYNVEFSTNGTGGSQSVEIAHDFGSALYIGPSISLQRTAPYGHCQVGDDAGANIAGPTFVVSNYSQQVCLGSKRWTIVIRPAAALTGVSGTFSVVRRGF